MNLGNYEFRPDEITGEVNAINLATGEIRGAVSCYLPEGTEICPPDMQEARRKREEETKRKNDLKPLISSHF